MNNGSKIDGENFSLEIASLHSLFTYGNILNIGSPYKFLVTGKLLKKVTKPSYSEVGLPYILTRKFLLS